jgi:diadenosine tetraphosphatase ApaH/serine/threonine PP2A family protein phosphatase
MLTALLADLHANREAVSACIDHAEKRGVERYVLLGDFVGYGADPGWVVDTVRELVSRGAVAVLGNHDAAVAQSLRPGLNPEARKAVEWTRGQLDASQIDFLARLPLRVEDDPYLFVHANAWAPQDYEYVSGVMEAGRSIRSTRARITFCGHVHEPCLYHMGLTQRVEIFKPVPGTPIPLSAARRWLALPGSTGQPRDGNPAACYATFDPLNNNLYTLWRIPYDYDAAARKVRDAGLPQRLARRLEGGV